MTVVDASVYMALVNTTEEQHETCWSWIEASRGRGEYLKAPAILAPEVGAAVSRGMRDPELAKEVVDQLFHSGVVELVPVTGRLAERAARIAVEQRIRGADALYVALAAQIFEPLVTLDRQQLERSPKLVVALRPGDAIGDDLRRYE